jgi:glycerophosphoryl diester phosphodiesterase
MSTRQHLTRVAKLESLIRPESDGNTSTTLEELCRSMWRANKKQFMEMAKNNSYQLFVYQFEQEDASAAALKGRRLGASS